VAGDFVGAVGVIGAAGIETEIFGGAEDGGTAGAATAVATGGAGFGGIAAEMGAAGIAGMAGMAGAAAFAGGASFCWMIALVESVLSFPQEGQWTGPGERPFTGSTSNLNFAPQGHRILISILNDGLIRMENFPRAALVQGSPEAKHATAIDKIY
jgi:hypothetical protein